MNIVVLVKQVPDSGAERSLSPGDYPVERGSASNVINKMDELPPESRPSPTVVDAILQANAA